MKPEVKYRFIENLIQTKGEELLSQVQEIWKVLIFSEDQKKYLDRRMKKYRRETAFTCDEVKDRISRSQTFFEQNILPTK